MQSEHKDELAERWRFTRLPRLGLSLPLLMMLVVLAGALALGMRPRPRRVFRYAPVRAATPLRENARQLLKNSVPQSRPVSHFVVGATGESTTLINGRGLKERPPETSIEPERYPDGRVVKRSVLQLPQGPCLLKHFEPSFVPLHDIVHLRQRDFAEFYFEENSAWFSGFPTQSSVTFNCCTFAVAPFVGLTPEDFLDNHPTHGYPNPMQLLLDSYFDQIVIYSPNEALTEFPRDSRLQPDDVVCTVRTGGVLGFQHAARLRRRGDQNLLISKFGQGPILLTDLSFVLRSFPGDEVRVYRFREAAAVGQE